MKKKSAKERFWSKVRVDRETGCWIWTASVRTWSREPWDGGYGAFWLRRGLVVRAHIFAYRLLFGPIERGKVLLHGCDNRRCVNVLEHIRPGTQVQNVKDMIAKGRSNHQRKNGTIQKEIRDAQEGKAERECKGEPRNREDRNLQVRSHGPLEGSGLA